jgi:hypothetical protein
MFHVKHMYISQTMRLHKIWPIIRGQTNGSFLGHVLYTLIPRVIHSFIQKRGQIKLTRQYFLKNNKRRAEICVPKEKEGSIPLFLSFGAGSENRTRVSSLARTCSTTKPYPQYVPFMHRPAQMARVMLLSCSKRWRAWQDSNPQPLGPKPSALSIELQAHSGNIHQIREKSKNMHK